MKWTDIQPGSIYTFTRNGVCEGKVYVLSSTKPTEIWVQVTDIFPGSTLQRGEEFTVCADDLSEN